MASQTRLKETAPTTLPADFDEWDSGEPPATLPDDFDRFDTATTPTVKQALGVSAVPAHVIRMPEPQAARTLTPVKAEVMEVSGPVPSFRTSLETEHGAGNKRRTMLIWSAIGSAVVVLLLLTFLLPRLNRKPSPATVVVSQPVVSEQPDPPTVESVPAVTKPTPATPLKQQPAPSFKAVQQPAVDSEAMSNQLSAPTMIPREVKTPQKETAPPPAVVPNGVEGLGGNSSAALGTVFNGQARPKVKVELPKMVTISSGVAQGMLIQKTTPIYPAIAKTARVSGTVVLQATISKWGAVEDVHVLSGPMMLRQYAVDAVKGWRYKPYRLDNQPVDVDTTVSVVFNLGN
jgi:protein TonB